MMGSAQQSGRRQLLLQHGNSIVAPERFTFEKKQRYAEYVIFLRFVLRALVGLFAFALLVGQELVRGQAQARDHLRDRIRLIGLQLPPKEPLVDLAAVIEQAAVLLGTQAT